MNIENHDCDSLNGSPDPTWGYYLLWHQLQRIKAQINMVSITIGQVEIANTLTDREIGRLLIEPLQGLECLRDEFPYEDDEEANA